MAPLPVRTDLESFFPAGIEFEIRPVAVPGHLQCTAAERACVERAVPKRQAEFLTGRVAARAALARLGVPATEILVGPGRSPLWPEGVVGSITHDDEFCVAAVARSSSVAGLGLDCEPDTRMEEELWERICTPMELAWIANSAERDPGDWVKLFFSAKEAVYKYQYPATRAFIGFQDVELNFFAEGSKFLVRPQGPNCAPIFDLVEGSAIRVAGRLICLVQGSLKPV